MCVEAQGKVRVGLSEHLAERTAIPNAINAKLG